MEQQEQIILKSLITKIADLPDYSPVRYLIYSYLQKELSQKIISVKVSGNALLLNEKNIDLSRRKKILKVFEIFLDQTTTKISRLALIEKVYSKQSPETSLRQQSCYDHNVVKLISRARHLIVSFCQKELDAKVHWFPYDPSSRTWQLYTIKEALVS